MQRSSGSLLTLVYCASFLYQLSLNTYGPFLPIFSANLGASYLEIGIIGLAGSLVQVPTSLVFGRLSGRLPVKRLMWLAVALAASTIGLLSVVQNVSEIVVLLLLLGLGSGTFWPIADAFVSEIAVAQPREKVLGRYSASWGAGLLVGPLLGGYVVTYLGYRAGFLVSASIVGLCLAVVVLGIIPHYSGRPIRQEVRPDRVEWGAVASSRPNRLVVASLAGVNSFVLGMIYVVFPRYAEGLSIAPLQLGVLFSTYAVARLILFLSSHRISMSGIIRSLGLSAGLLVVSGAILGSTSSFFVFLFAFVLLGISAGISIPAIMNLFARTDSGGAMTRTMGVYEAVSGGGIVSGSFTGGAVANYVTPAAPYFLASALTLASLPLILLAGRGGGSGGRRLGEQAGSPPPRLPVQRTA